MVYSTPKVDAELERAARENLWLHAYQMTHLIEKKPTFIVRGEGSHVWDNQGKEYIDARAGLFCVNVGYGRKEIADAIYEQLLAIPYVSSFNFPSIPAAQFAERLARLAPNENPRVVLVCGGSEAVESALKVARQYQAKKGYPRRYKTISRKVAYHGVTLGALSVTGLTSWRAPFEPLVPGACHVPIPYCYRCEFGLEYPSCDLECAKAVERVIEFEDPETVSALIMEPVQNSGGCIVPPPEYFPFIRELCTRYGVVMIMDEVLTGFGRTGKWFGSEHWGVVPDITTCAKGISSGYVPLGATIVKKEMADIFLGEEDNKLMHGFTFGDHPVSAAAGLANIDIMERENLNQRAMEMGEYLKKRLHEALDDHPMVGDIRGLGLFVGIELVKNKETKEQLQAGTELMGWLTDNLLERGIICRSSDRLEPVIQLSPPLIISKEDLDRVVTVIEEVITGLEKMAKSKP